MMYWIGMACYLIAGALLVGIVYRVYRYKMTQRMVHRRLLREMLANAYRRNEQIIAENVAYAGSMADPLTFRAE